MQRIIFTLFLCLLVITFNDFGQSKTKKTNSLHLTVVQNVETIDQKITRISNSYRLDPRLFQSLIYAESTFKLSAYSPKGAGCLTQLMPATARRFGLIVNNLQDERFSNIEKCLNAGAQYLAFLLNTFKGDVRLALAGYNAGEGAVMKFGWRIPPYKETTQYVEKICNLYYGQSGHGVAMAYNQPLAQSWTNALYQNWRVRRTNQVSAVKQQIPQTVNADQNNAGNNSATVEDKSVSKKTVVARVKVPEPNTRLRTESLSFY